MAKIAYLDYAATTPVDPRVSDAMNLCLLPDEIFSNPSSTTHTLGQQAFSAVDEARSLVASLREAEPHEIIWTSGATEAINLAIKGVLHSPASRGRHIITSCLEHSAVLDTCKTLARDGFDVTFLSPDANGLFTADIVETALRKDTGLISLMQINNEIGTIADISAIGQLTKCYGVPFHVELVVSDNTHNQCWRLANAINKRLQSVCATPSSNRARPRY